MKITVGSYVRINEQCRNRAARGLLCRVQALECRRLSAIVPTQFAHVRVLGLDEHVEGDAPEWWTPCSEIRYVGDEPSCIGTHEAGEAAARCFLPFRLSAGAVECSLEVPRVPSRAAGVTARLRRARPCSNNVLPGRKQTTPSALPKLIPSEIGGRPLRLSAHETQLATGSSLLQPSTHGLGDGAQGAAEHVQNQGQPHDGERTAYRHRAGLLDRARVRSADACPLPPQPLRE